MKYVLRRIVEETSEPFYSVNYPHGENEDNVFDSYFEVPSNWSPHDQIGYISLYLEYDMEYLIKSISDPDSSYYSVSNYDEMLGSMEERQDACSYLLKEIERQLNSIDHSSTDDVDEWGDSSKSLYDHTMRQIRDLKKLLRYADNEISSMPSSDEDPHQAGRDEWNISRGV